jgi:hypothetical protein
MQLRRLLPITGGRLADKRQQDRAGGKRGKDVAENCAGHGKLHRRGLDTL